jgi:multisubunit Na+/H+ antiporter MnhE subunit
MDVGQSQLFTSTVSGGTSPYFYQWYLNGSAVSGATSATWTFTATISGSYSVYVNATDNVGLVAKSNVASVTVNPAPSVLISPGSATLDVGQSQTFTSTVTGGTYPFSYQWYLDGSSVSGATSLSWTYSPSASGSHTVYVKVTDSASTPATVQSNSASVTVNGAFSVTISPSSVTLDVGQSKNFTSTVTGGTSPYSYQWYLGGSAISGATSSYYVYTPSSSGSYSIYLNVTDSASTPKVAKSNTATVTVNAAFSVSISPTSATLDVGQSKTFTSIVTGGTGSHTYQWYLNGTLVGTGSNYTFTPGSPGFHNIYLNVTDSLSMKAKSNTATVTVNAAPSVTISPSTWTMDVGQSKLFTSSVSGGSGPYSYHWYLDGVAFSGATGATWTYTPSAAGSHTVYVKVTDSASTPVTATSNTATVTVNGALSVTISPGTVTMDVGQPKTFTSTVTGGTSSYSYQWYLNGVAVSGANSSAWTFTPGSLGSYSVYVNVTDSVGVKVKSNVATVTVNTAPSVGILPTSATIHVGNSQVFTSTVSGGTSPPSYQWYLNGSAVSGATSATWTFTPSSTGSYNVYVKVTDAVGTVATSTASTVMVLPVIPEFQPSMLLPLFMIITLLGAIMLKRKRNAKTTQSTATE